MRVWVLAVALLAVPSLAQAGPLVETDLCLGSSPCGRIYPFITIETDAKGVVHPITMGQEIVVDAVLTYRFDVDQEGYTQPEPTRPVTVIFEYPRLPKWAELSVEPETFRIPVEDPRHIQADTSDPATPQLEWRYSVPIQIRAKLVGQAILRDGFDHHKLLVFAKSAESGLYMPGYGLREVRVAPEGALHESDVAGQRDVFTTSPLPPLDVQPVEAAFAGTTVRLHSPEATKPWQPATFRLDVEPTPTGRVVAALHDEAGALVHATPPMPAAAQIAFNATIAHPGHHTATLTILPEPGGATPPATFALPFTTGDLSAEGYTFPKSYLVTAREAFQPPLVNQADPFTQFERDIPFFAFETAQSATASLVMTASGSDGLAPGPGNLQFMIVDPDGKPLVQSSVDPTAPARAIRAGSLPMDGWYTLRLRGVGLPNAVYDARIEVAYSSAPSARNRADGVPDATGPLLGRAGVNLTLPFETLAVFGPSDLTPLHDAPGLTRYQLTVLDAQGEPVYGSGLREGPATFTAPAPGRYRAFVYAEPGSPGTPFSPFVRAFTFDVGQGTTTLATKFAIDDVFEAPARAAAETLLGFHVVPVHEGAGDLAVEAGGNARTDLLGATDGALAPGRYHLLAYAANAAAGPAPVPVRAEQTYATAVTLAGPMPPAPEAMQVPWGIVGIALVVVGGAAVVFAARRK